MLTVYDEEGKESKRELTLQETLLKLKLISDLMQIMIDLQGLIWKKKKIVEES